LGRRLRGVFVSGLLERCAERGIRNLFIHEAAFSESAHEFFV
jgi:hypothetical protein